MRTVGSTICPHVLAAALLAILVGGAVAGEAKPGGSATNAPGRVGARHADSLRDRAGERVLRSSAGGNPVSRRLSAPWNFSTRNAIGVIVPGNQAFGPGRAGSIRVFPSKHGPIIGAAGPSVPAGLIRLTIPLGDARHRSAAGPVGGRIGGIARPGTVLSGLGGPAKTLSGIDGTAFRPKR